MPIDIFKILIGFIVVFLLSKLCCNIGPFFRVLKSAQGRNLFSVLVGSAILFFIIEEWALFFIVGVLLCYGLMYILQRPFLVSAICASVMVVVVHSHRLMYRMSYCRNFASKQWKVDSSAYIMFLATKLTYYGLWLSKQKDKK